MSFLKHILFIILVILLFFANRSLGQEYILFKKQKGFSDTMVSHNIRMYLNQVESISSDTVVHFYNFYCTSFPNIIPSSIDQRKPEVDTSGISTDLLVTAIVGYKSDTTGILKKLPKRNLAS
ncbi:MAG: hypothetical protein EOP48_23390 [Sphingobacteriales bacterium]|nr:MAG: hypothetical protein EOP48_23390 [Sphingobacteriales bacterium]